MANGTAQVAGTLATYRVLRELGRRSQPSYAAVHGDGSTVVLHRFTRDPKREGALVSAAEMAIILRDARSLEKTWHPNVARVRHVDLAGEDLHIATELIEGVTLDDLLTFARARRAATSEPLLSHAILARILLDVLAGLQALHSLRDGRNAALSAFHGELCPANVVVGKDGIARIVAVFRPRPVTIGPRSEALGYASPETIAGEVDQDARADVYAVGVMLWEALTQRRLYDDVDPGRIAHRQREDDVVLPDGPLADVAMRALAFDPALRFRTAHEMATDLRAFAETIAPGSAVAQNVLDLAGERIRARRTELDRHAAGSHRSTSMPPPLRSGTHARVSAPLLAQRPPTSPPPPPPLPNRRSPSLATMTPSEFRLAPPPPDVSTSYSPRPLPARRGTGTLPPPLLPKARATPSTPPVPRSGVSSLPPPKNDEADHDELPGPRESTPDKDHVEQLASEVRAAKRATVGPFPRQTRASRAVRRGTSTRTPFVVDVRPSNAPASTPPAVAGVRRYVPLLAAIATAALVLLVIGTTLLVRSAHKQAATNASSTHAPSPPSTVVIAPPRAEELPPPRSATSATAPAQKKPLDDRSGY